MSDPTHPLSSSPALSLSKYLPCCPCGHGLSSLSESHLGLMVSLVSGKFFSSSQRVGDVGQVLFSAWKHTPRHFLYAWLWPWRDKFRSQNVFWCLHPSHTSVFSFLSLSHNLILEGLFLTQGWIKWFSSEHCAFCALVLELPVLVMLAF